MAREAVVENGIVTNIIEGHLDESIPCPDEVNIGWGYAGETFTAPSIVPPTIEEQILELEHTITPRRLREAMLNKGQGMQFINDIDDAIETLRLQLPV